MGILDKVELAGASMTLVRDKAVEGPCASARVLNIRCNIQAGKPKPTSSLSARARNIKK